jgi:uncharacterized cupredoxin-like copper-binding protein
MKHLYQLLLVSLLAIGGTAVAHEGDEPSAALGTMNDSATVSRTIKIDMGDDMRYSPANVKVKRGETIRFVVTNRGRLKHEMVLGNIKELREHDALMRKFPEMEHDDPDQLAVDAGNTGELIAQFTKTGTFDFACLQPGHFEAGMRGKVAVR